jgi:hypothetical protein
LEVKNNPRKETQFKTIRNVEEEKAKCLHSSIIYTTLQFFNKFQLFFYIASFITLQILYPSIILAVFYIGFYLAIYDLINNSIPKLELKVLKNVGNKWTELEQSYLLAKKNLEEINRNQEIEYENICVNLNYYPPDWELRRRKVLERDNYCCTECGWPNGYKRKARELHIHHIIPLSQGGDNSIENLATLCHICHKKVDKIHHIVRNNKRKIRKK